MVVPAVEVVVEEEDGLAEDLLEDDVGSLEGYEPEDEGEIVTSLVCFNEQLSSGVTGEVFVTDPPNSSAAPGFGKTGSTPSTVAQLPSSNVLAR